MTQSDRFDQLFPRDILGRFALGIVSLLLAPISGVALYGIARNAKPVEFLDYIWVLIVEEFLLGLFLFFSAGLIWALFTPQWVERVQKFVAQKLAWGLFLFTMMGSGFAFWALFWK